MSSLRPLALYSRTPLRPARVVAPLQLYASENGSHPQPQAESGFPHPTWKARTLVSRLSQLAERKDGPPCWRQHASPASVCNMVTVSCQPVIGKRLYKPPRWGKFTKYLFAAIQTDRATRPQHRPVFNAAASKASWEDFQIALLKLNSPAGTQGTWGELAIVRGPVGWLS